MRDLIDGMVNRRAQLREELELLDRLLELHEWQVLEVASTTSLNQPQARIQPSHPPDHPAVQPFTIQASGMTAVLRAAEAYLRKKGSRARSVEIYEALIEQGLLASGARNNVTSYLGRAKRTFDNVRGVGYGLTEWRKTRT